MRKRVMIFVVLLGAGAAIAGDMPCSETQVLASDGAASLWFGYSVSVRDGVAVIGALGDDANGMFSGSAFVYELSGGTWLEQVELLPSDGGDYWNFGASVAIGPDVLIVGAIGANELGAAYVFRRDQGTWTQDQKLNAADGGLFSNFGGALAIQGDVLAVGAMHADSPVPESGAVYVFVDNGDTFSQHQKLWASDAGIGDAFGASVALDGEWLVVGASFDDADNGFFIGSAYMFRWNGTSWEEHQKLTAFDAIEGDVFGTAVAVSGDVAVVGAPAGSNFDDPGTAHVFRWNGSSWELEQQLTASDAEGDFNFGGAISFDGATILVGAWRADGAAANTGAAYAFRYDGASWFEDVKLQALDGRTADRFGQSAVAVTGNVVLVGARGDDDQGAESGSAYFFELECSAPCPADVSGDGEVGVTDLTFVILAWGQVGGAADVNGDGIVDVLDLVEVITNWGPCS